jgi:putative membrane-bound dehydrogenase-like protein
MIRSSLRVALSGASAALFLAAVSAQGPSTAAPVFTLPTGFEVERVAGPPLVDRPIVADFDERGRLFVADSSGSNDKVEQQLADRPHRILRLADRDGDGRFDTRTVFADRMMLPQGTLWYDGSLYVAAPPSIWKLTDTDDDGVADRREEWFAGKTLTGCANDLHGPYLGPDGWIYWTKGAFAEQRYERPGRDALVTRAAHVFRRRPGTHLVEAVIAGGMDNPVDVAFTASGDAMLTATFLEHPQGGRRDALIHAVYGGLYGKPHGVIEGHPQTGDLMPPVCHLGPAAPSGLAAYQSAVFGDGYRGNFFTALFNMQKVVRHVLEPSGATFKSRDIDFLVSESLDFHPTDVLEDADGSLLVVDTGAWYKLCCPTSQLAKPDVLGAIYRVKRRGGRGPADPRGQRLPWETAPSSQLIARLDDARPAVRERAIQLLSKRGAESVSVLEAALNAPSIERRRNAVWALTRIDESTAREAVRLAIADRHESVRRAAMHSAGLWRDAGAVTALLGALDSASPASRRSAAEALGRIGDSRAVPALLQTAALPLDRIGEHSVTYALIEIADAAATTTGVTATSPRTRAAAVLALDQMRGGGLDPAAVVPLLDAPDAHLRDTAWRVALRHKDWGAALVPHFERAMAAAGKDVALAQPLEQRLAAFAPDAAVQSLLARVAAGESEGSRAVALRAMAASRIKPMPDAWVAALAGVAQSAPPSEARLAVAVAVAVPGALEGESPLRSALLAVARDSSRSRDVRIDALSAASHKDSTLDEGEFALVTGALAPAEAVPVRMAAATLVARVALSERQLQQLVEVVRESGPLELPRLLPAFDRGRAEGLGLALVAALEQCPGRSSLRPDILRPRLDRYPPAVRARGEALLASLSADATRQAARLDQLVAGMLGGGDVRRGQTLFNSTKAACASCHAMGYRGGTLGPDLTAIGQIRSERDLLEAIVFPNASFVRGYEPVVVTTSGGGTHAGVLRDEGVEHVVVLTAAGEETRVPRSDIAALQPGVVSLMPAGYGEQLSRQELADLVAFLKNARWGVN